MPRGKLSFGDVVKGSLRSIMNGTGTSGFANLRQAQNARNERLARLDDDFGTGEVGGDRNWTPPVHGSTRDGRPVTVSFGIGSRAGQTLICDGHMSWTYFYKNRRDGMVGHDHYLVDGQPAGKKGDRGRYSD